MILLWIWACWAATFAESSPVPIPDDPVDRTLITAYGAIFLTTATPPPTIRFPDQKAIDAFVAELDTVAVVIDGRALTLQRPAAQALASARDVLAAEGITLQANSRRPGGRSYDDSVVNWKSRVGPGLDHWVAEGKIASDERDRIARLDPQDQIGEILELEARGLWFNTYRNRTILTSVAAPGSTQHHSLLAVDLRPAKNARVVEVLADHGWHRTVWADRPHYTYLGRSKDDLLELGLVEKDWAEATFLVPDLAD